MTPSIPAPPPMPRPPTYSDASIQLAGQRQRTAAQRASTAMTTGDTSTPNLAGKTLLGA